MPTTTHPPPLTDLDIARNIRAELYRAGWTQTDLADKTRMQRLTLNRKLNGSGPWRATEVHAIATALGVPITTLTPNPEVQP